MQSIQGFHAVREALAASPRRIRKIVLAEGKSDPRAQEIVSLARVHGIPVYREPRERLGRFGGQHQGVVAELTGFEWRDLGELLDADVQPVRDGEAARLDEHVAPPELAPLDPGEVHGDALAGGRPLDRLVVHLDAPHAPGDPARLHPQQVAGADRPRPERPGDDRADAREREDAVDVEAGGQVGCPLDDGDD